MFRYICDLLRPSRFTFKSTLIVFILIQLITMPILAAAVFLMVGELSSVVLGFFLGLVVFEVTVLLILTRKVRTSRFLAWALGDEAADEILGDLGEVYLRERGLFGQGRARRRYQQALFSLIVRKFWDSVVRLAIKRRA
jgi:hypothetical protein